MIWRPFWVVFASFLLSSDCLVLRFRQKNRTSTLKYTKQGLILSFDEGQSRCLPPLGCFSSGGPFFHPPSRPLSLLPQSRHQVAPAFLLYTRRHPYMFRLLTSGIADTFRPVLLNTETKVVVPGWGASVRKTTWLQDMKDALLNYGDINVIIVDWSNSNRVPYALAVANARVVGAELALLINYMKEEFGIDPESFHIIGHGVGAEIAGYAGEHINKLGRITALNPAGPYFRNVSTEVRLDPSDALFVDAIHTHAGDEQDAQKPGRMEQTGHVDFYPNGGDYQPGCPEPESAVNNIIKKPTNNAPQSPMICDHFRAIEFFLATIPNHYGCHPVGVACDSWAEFEAGRCSDCSADGSQCAIMGFGADVKKDVLKRHTPKKFFLVTSPEAPFCVQQYHVSVKLQDSSLMSDTFGEIVLELKGRFGSISLDINKRKRVISRGDVYKGIVTSPEDIDVIGVGVRWSCSTLKITEEIQIDLEKKPEECVLFLHSAIITTFTTSALNPGKQLVTCGPDSPIPPNVNVTLETGTHCMRDLY